MLSLRIRPALCCSILTGAIFASFLRATEVRIAGTDLLGAEFSKALHEFAGQHRLDLRLAFDGSRPGRDALATGKADLALLTLPSDEAVSDPAWCAVTVAYHRIVVIAPADSPLDRISFAQLGKIFGGLETSAVPGADQRGGDEPGAPDALMPLAPEAGIGVGLEYFRHVVLRGRAFKLGVVRYRESASLWRRLKDGEKVLALALEFSADIPAAKMVAVAAQAQGPAFLPTPENLRRGDYPLCLPVRMVFRRDAATRLRPLVVFLAGSGAAPHFQRAGVVPLPEAGQAEHLAAIEKM